MKLTKDFTELLKNPFAIKVYRELAAYYRTREMHDDADAFDALKREILNGDNSTNDLDARTEGGEDTGELGGEG